MLLFKKHLIITFIRTRYIKRYLTILFSFAVFFIEMNKARYPEIVRVRKKPKIKSIFLTV